VRRVIVGDGDVDGAAGIGLSQHIELPLFPLLAIAGGAQDGPGGGSILVEGSPSLAGLVQEAQELGCDVIKGNMNSFLLRRRHELVRPVRSATFAL